MNKVDMNQLYRVLFGKTETETETKTAGDISITENHPEEMAELRDQEIREAMDPNNVSESDMIKTIQDTGERIDEKSVTSKANKDRVEVLNGIVSLFNDVSHYEDHLDNGTLGKTSKHNHKKDANAFCSQVTKFVNQHKTAIVDTIDPKVTLSQDVRAQAVVKGDIVQFDKDRAILTRLVDIYNRGNLWHSYKKVKETIEMIDQYVAKFRLDSAPAAPAEPAPYVVVPHAEPESPRSRPPSPGAAAVGDGFNMPLKNNKDVLKAVSKIVNVKEQVRDPKYRQIEQKSTEDLKKALRKMLKVPDIDNALEKNIYMVLSLLKIRGEIDRTEIMATLLYLRKRRPE
jgi:hypothetical protein